MDFNAGTRALGQGVGEFTPDGIVPENIHLEEDRALGAAYRLEPGGKILARIEQKTNGVAADRIGARRAREGAISKRKREFRLP